MQEALGLLAPTGDIGGAPVQGPLPDPQQRGPVCLTHKRAAAHEAAGVPKHRKLSRSWRGR